MTKFQTSSILNTNDNKNVINEYNNFSMDQANNNNIFNSNDNTYKKKTLGKYYNNKSIRDKRNIYRNNINKNRNRNDRKIRFTKGMFKKKFYRNLVYLNLRRHCYIYLRHTINNTFITVKDRRSKKILLVKSSGSIGFKGPKRPSAYAAKELGKFVREKIRKTKRTATIVILSKISSNIKNVIKSLPYKRSFKILDIVQKIPVSHNGMRERHARRK